MSLHPLEGTEATVHPGLIDDPSADVTVIVAPSSSVEEAISILEGVVDLMTVNGWVGLASEVADVRDLIQYGVTQFGNESPHKLQAT